MKRQYVALRDVLVTAGVIIPGDNPTDAEVVAAAEEYAKVIRSKRSEETANIGFYRNLRRTDGTVIPLIPTQQAVWDEHCYVGHSIFSPFEQLQTFDRIAADVRRQAEADGAPIPTDGEIALSIIRLIEANIVRVQGAPQD